MAANFGVQYLSLPYMTTKRSIVTTTLVGLVSLRYLCTTKGDSRSRTQSVTLVISGSADKSSGMFLSGSVLVATDRTTIGN